MGAAGRVLTGEMIRGLNLDRSLNLKTEGAMYIQAFLINSRQNHAADPKPFKIHPKSLRRIAASAYGRPWLPYPQPDGKHHKPHEYASANEMLEYQKKFAGGEIVAVFVNEESQNANVIIEVYPEFQDDVRNNKIPPYVSPMVHNYTVDKQGQMVGADIIHLQSVKTPGYDAQIAKINGVCTDKGLRACMMELRPMAAAGVLGQFRKARFNTCHRGLPMGARGVPTGARKQPGWAGLPKSPPNVRRKVPVQKKTATVRRQRGYTKPADKIVDNMIAERASTYQQRKADVAYEDEELLRGQVRGAREMRRRRMDMAQKSGILDRELGHKLKGLEHPPACPTGGPVSRGYGAWLVILIWQLTIQSYRIAAACRYYGSSAGRCRVTPHPYYSTSRQVMMAAVASRTHHMRMRLGADGG